jgi:hypothetical protein
MKTSDLRDRFDIAASVADHRRAARAGGPKEYIRSPTGRTRGVDRFPRRRPAASKR